MNRSAVVTPSSNDAACPGTSTRADRRNAVRGETRHRAVDPARARPLPGVGRVGHCRFDDKGIGDEAPLLQLGDDRGGGALASLGVGRRTAAVTPFRVKTNERVALDSRGQKVAIDVAVEAHAMQARGRIGHVHPIPCGAARALERPDVHDENRRRRVRRNIDLKAADAQLRSAEWSSDVS
jgi:hypothetical protein